MFKRFSRLDSDLFFLLTITVVGLFSLLYRTSPLLALALTLAAILLYVWNRHQVLRKGERTGSGEDPARRTRHGSGA